MSPLPQKLSNWIHNLTQNAKQFASRGRSNRNRYKPNSAFMVSQFSFECRKYTIGLMPYRVPPNAKFEIDDMELEWTFPDNHFDYIHIRSLSGSFKDWDTVLKQAFE